MSPVRKDSGSYGLWQVRAEEIHVDQGRRVQKWHTTLSPGERVIPTSDHYHSGHRPGTPSDPAVAAIIRARAQWRKRERWWHSWEAFWRYHKRMYVSMRNEQHYDCVPLIDLREAANRPEPSWREQHWRGLYAAKWAGGVWLFVQLLRV